MDCRVVVEAAVPVYDVETADEAVRIAISKTGEMLNPDLNYVEIDMGGRACPHCDEELEPAFIAADEGLVALELEMTVFNVERKEHASRIARKEIGQLLSNIPLDVIEVEELDEEQSEAADQTDGEMTDTNSDESATDTTAKSDDAADTDEATEHPTDSDDEADSAAAAEDTEEDNPAEAAEDETPEDTGQEDDPSSAAEDDEDGDVMPEFEELLDE